MKMSSEHEKESLDEPTPEIDDGHCLTEEERTPFNLRRFLKEEFWPELKYLVSEIIAHNRLKSRKKKGMRIFFLLITVWVFYDLLFGGYISSWLESFILWMTAHSIEAVFIEAVFAFVAIFILSTLLLIPPTILIFGAGYAFAQAIGITTGIFAATLSCFLGSCIGAVIAFLRGRYMMRDLVQKFSMRYPLIRAADQALKRKGFHTMVLLRFCPLIPFNGLNYCCGITGVPVRTFVYSLVGILPFQMFTVIVGATAGTLVSSHSGLLGWIILICSGSIFGSIALVYIWKLVKQELQKELDLTEEEIDQYCHPQELDLTEEEIDQYLTSSAHEDHQQTTDDIEKGVGELVRKLTFDDHEAFTLTPKVPNHVAEASTNLALDISSKEVQQPPLRRRAFTAPTLRPPSSVPFMRVDDLEMVESRTNSRTEEEMDPYSTTAYHQDKQTTQTTDDIEKGVGELVRKSLEEEDEEWFWVWA